MQFNFDASCFILSFLVQARTADSRSPLGVERGQGRTNGRRWAAAKRTPSSTM